MLPQPEMDTNPESAQGDDQAVPVDRDGIGKPPHVPGWDPDAKLLAARGVSSYEELNAKYREGERIA